MEYIIVIVVALVGACLSFFSGFGLGTMLLPAFMLFFPPPVAVAATAVVHMLNNIFKLFLVGKHADWGIVKSFGLLSMVGALLGAWLLWQLESDGTLFSYFLFDHKFEMSWIKVVMAFLIIVFSLLEINKRWQSRPISKKYLPLGGLASGFFGGLSGHQGALRSAFLMKAGMTKEAFMGSRVVIACMVDMTRITVYAAAIGAGWHSIHPTLLVVATLAAFSGAYIGNRLVKSTEMPVLNKIITICLLVFAVLLGAGWI